MLRWHNGVLIEFSVLWMSARLKESRASVVAFCKRGPSFCCRHLDLYDEREIDIAKDSLLVPDPINPYISTC
jgi:hypothetical protein